MDRVINKCKTKGCKSGLCEACGTCSQHGPITLTTRRQIQTVCRHKGKKLKEAAMKDISAQQELNYCEENDELFYDNDCIALSHPKRAKVQDNYLNDYESDDNFSDSNSENASDKLLQDLLIIRKHEEAKDWQKQSDINRIVNAILIHSLGLSPCKKKKNETKWKKHVVPVLEKIGLQMAIPKVRAINAALTDHESIKENGKLTPRAKNKVNKESLRDAVDYVLDGCTLGREDH
eukprot:Pgem_evm1s19982